MRLFLTLALILAAILMVLGLWCSAMLLPLWVVVVQSFCVTLCGKWLLQAICEIWTPEAV